MYSWWGRIFNLCILIFKNGSDINFAVAASQGDPDFAEYWARDQADEKETRFNTIGEGLDRIASNQEIMHVDEGQLKGYLRANPFREVLQPIFRQ